jgi:hypothetical protein
VVANAPKCSSALILEHGFCAEIIIGKEHLRLFSEDGPLGVQASVYNVSGKNWVPSESVRDIEEGKDRAAAHAAAYLRRVLNVELPNLVWKQARSV